MNYLAHIFLSNSYPTISVGNLLTDKFKGKSYLKLSKDFQIGVLLHRSIDNFTDNHKITKNCCRKLFPKHRHYSRVIIDCILIIFWQRTGINLMTLN